MQKFISYIKGMTLWQLIVFMVCIAIIISELLTVAQSYWIHGELHSDLLIIAFFTPAIDALLLVYILSVLLQQLKLNEEKLKHHKNNLENLIDERTKELKQVNNDLRKEIADRVLAEKAKTKMEAQLRQAEKMQAIGLLAGGVAHDLNNILSAITGYPELMLLQLPQESQMRKPLEAIKDSGERAAAVVSDLLTVARGVASSRRVVSLNSLVDEFIVSPECDHLRSLHPEVSCSKDLDDNLSNISCSPVHIKKCIMNLVTNAVEAMDHFGTVLLHTSSTVPEPQWCKEHGVEPTEYVVLTVTDTGTGIPKNSIKHIFEPFYSKKVLGRSGTGLGLTVVWNTIKEHRGTVTVTSSDQGTSFKLFIPATQKGVSKTELATDNDTFQGNGEKILVVDDESHLRDIASQMLRTLGYNVALACSGEEAVAYLQDHRVDLVLLDMLMDPGINGRQTYERIIKLHPGQKAIIASGFSESEDVKATLKIGTNSFLMKPFSMNELGQAVQNALSL